MHTFVFGVDKRINNFEEGMSYYILVFYKERGMESVVFTKVLKGRSQNRVTNLQSDSIWRHLEISPGGTEQWSLCFVVCAGRAGTPLCLSANSALGHSTVVFYGKYTKCQVVIDHSGTTSKNQT